MHVKPKKYLNQKTRTRDPKLAKKKQKKKVYTIYTNEIKKERPNQQKKNDMYMYIYVNDIYNDLHMNHYYILDKTLYPFLKCQ